MRLKLSLKNHEVWAVLNRWHPARVQFLNRDQKPARCTADRHLWQVSYHPSHGEPLWLFPIDHSGTTTGKRKTCVHCGVIQVKVLVRVKDLWAEKVERRQFWVEP